MKSAVNSYSAKATFSHAPAVGARVRELVPTIPNHVWLAMVLLTALLLAFSSLARARGQVRQAQVNLNATQSRLQQEQDANAALKVQTNRVKTNRSAAEQIGREQLHYLRPNEIVVIAK